MTELMKSLGPLNVAACLTELVRLKDWRDELGRTERAPGHDEAEMRRSLLRYGIEKKLAWARAKDALSRLMPAEGRPPAEKAERLLVERGAIEAAIKFLEYAEDDPDDHMEASALSLHFEHLLVDQAFSNPEWYRNVIAEEMGVDCPPGDAVCPLRDWLRELKHGRAVKKVPTHFAIARGNHYFAYLDISLGPTACVWKGIAEVHAFPTEREAREIMKICPPDVVLVPCRIELLPEPPAPLAANDSEGGHAD